MENPFAKLTTKDYLYIAGALASIIALAYVFGRGKTTPGPGVLTDVQNSAAPEVVDGNGINYLNYNTGAYNPTPIAVGSDLAPDTTGTSCCGANNDCAGPSPLATGDTFSSVNSLINYYQNTNPVYVQLQQAMLQQYAAYFATGQSYSKGVELGAAQVSGYNQ